MDGRTLYTPLFSGVFWDVQNYLLEDIDRIEVISGPGGTLWGANAVNGVINITSKSAQDTQGLYAQAGAPGLAAARGRRRCGTAARWPRRRLLPGSMRQSMPCAPAPRRLPNGTNATNGWDNGQGGFRIDAGGASPNNRVTLQGDYYYGNGEAIVWTGGTARVERRQRPRPLDSHASATATDSEHEPPGVLRPDLSGRSRFPRPPRLHPRAGRDP